MLLERGGLILGLRCVTEISFITVSTRNTQRCSYSSYVLCVLVPLFEVTTFIVHTVV